MLRDMPDEIFPMVSIIMPIKNEARYIERSLGAVLGQDYPAGLIEVLIVDGNSSDCTRELISDLVNCSKFPVAIFDNPSGIVPKALNIGLRHAKGEIVIRVDGHCEIQKDYVQICVNTLLNQDVDCVGGTTVTVGETFMAEAIALSMSTPFGVGNVAFRVSNGTTKLTDSVPFPAYWKMIFERLGYYDEEMLCNEDDEFNYRLLKNQGRILMANDLKTLYYSRGSLTSLWRQYFRYGLWKIRVMQKHPKQMRLRQFIPALFVLGVVTTVIWAFLFPMGWATLAAYFGTYFLAVLISSIRVANIQGWKYFPLLPAIFLILHLSYGVGFIFGLFKFRYYF
jgi:glycosyltransferase involved in cell wall biosynthesis